MWPGLRFGLLFMVFLCPGMIGAQGDLSRGFADPPPSAQTRAFWWWLNGNVTKPAITRDLEEMKAKGFGGVLLFDAGGAEQDGNRQVPAGPAFLSPEWRELFRHAVREAERVGLELSLNLQSGWNLGGPPVTPEHAAKLVTRSQTVITGPGELETALPEPVRRHGFYRDIAVVAYRDPDRGLAWEIASSSAHTEHPAKQTVDGDPASFWVSGGLTPGEGPSSQHPEWLQVTVPEPLSVSGARIVGRPGYGPRRGEVQVADAEGRFRNVCSLSVEDGAPAVARFDAVRGTTFRFVFHEAYDRGSIAAPRNVQVAEIGLLGEDGRELLARHRPIARLEHKLARHELGGSAPDGSVLLDDVPAVPGEEDCRSRSGPTAGDPPKNPDSQESPDSSEVGYVLDLSDKVDSAGRLRWQAPAGEWVVLRLGYTCSGAQVSTSSQGWNGLVLDYLDADALRWYWGEVVQPLIDDAGPAAGKTWKYVHTDSWECGGMNWTPGFRDEFRKRRGYDLLPFLPALAGKIVDDRAATNRFLADFRRTIGDCIAENHYGVMKELAHRHGMEIHPESGGPHGAPIDSLRCLGLSDIPMSEFWARSWRHRVSDESRFFVKQPASAAHTYGRRLVAAEGFTTIGPHWQETLWDNLKPSFDRACCEGLNRLFWTLVACSPAEMGLPGQDMFAGTHFNPNSTWWGKSHAFLTYLNRCQYLLQQGLFVADVCYYYGDHVPNFAQLKQSDPARVLPGYDYDVATEEVVLNRMEVQDGRIVLPDGMSYRLLVLPNRTNISLPVLRKIEQLVQAGATVLGPKPHRATGLEGDSHGDVEVRAIAEQLWGACDGESVTEHAFGRGRVIWGPTARDVLAADGVPPDAEFLVEVNGQPQPASGIDYIHRRTEQSDIYFLSNQGPAPANFRAVFRVAGRRPELWDPVSGTIRDALAFAPLENRTAVPLMLPPYGSLFVVFRVPGDDSRQATHATNEFVLTTVSELAGPWQVSFDPLWGGPANVTFDKLEDWTARPEEGIKHYSGTAVYRNAFDLPPPAQAAVADGKKVFLDVGKVKELAEVRLNGQSLGVVWCPPWRVDVTGAVRERDNRLEVDVVNFWPNRLIGDAALPPERRRTATNITKFTADTPLMESGLLGPVILQLEE
jgi:hypothetical protein